MSGGSGKTIVSLIHLRIKIITQCLKLRSVSSEFTLDCGITGIERRLCECDKARALNADDLLAVLRFLCNLQAIFSRFALKSISNLGKSQPLSDLRSDLCSITINCLLAAEDRVKSAFFLFNLLDGVGNDVGSSKGVRSTERTTGYKSPYPLR
jgi:hypothetical protein